MWYGDITVAVKCVWNVITADRYSFYCLRGSLLPPIFEVCIGTGLVDALKVQSSGSNTKVQVRGWPGVCLTRSMHFVLQNIKTIARFNSVQTDCQFYYGNLYWKRRAHLGSCDLVIPSLVLIQLAYLFILLRLWTQDEGQHSATTMNTRWRSTLC